MEKMNNLCQKSEQWFIFREEAGTGYRKGQKGKFCVVETSYHFT